MVRVIDSEAELETDLALARFEWEQGIAPRLSLAKAPLKRRRTLPPRSSRSRTPLQRRPRD